MTRPVDEPLDSGRPTGRDPLLVVALDHAAYGAVDLVPRGARFGRLVDEVSPVADAFLVTVDDAPAVVGKGHAMLRADTCQLYGNTQRPWATVINPRAMAVAGELGIGVLAVNLFAVSDHPEVLAEGEQRVRAFTEEAHSLGLSVMVEALDLGAAARGLPGEMSTAAVRAVAQAAARCGADSIKVDACHPFAPVVQAAGAVPVLLRGGARRDEAGFIEDCAALVREGACGVVVGRNILQSPEPGPVLARLRTALQPSPTP